MNTPIAPGFDPRWKDIPEFTFQLGQDFWESRDLSSVSDRFSQDAVFRSADRILRGPSAIAGHLTTERAALPETEMLGEDALWCETPRTEGRNRPGLHCSGRFTLQARHLGDGLYGAATGKDLTIRHMIDLWSCENTVEDVWLVRDTRALCNQMDLDPMEAARTQIILEGGPEACAPPLTPDTDVDGSYSGRGPSTSTAEQLADLMRRTVGGEMSIIPSHYDRACELHLPGGVPQMGHRPAERFWLGLRSAFPSASFRIDHRMGQSDPASPPRAALRWSLYGKHEGFGAFGPPSGAYVFIMGITHAEFGPRGLRREWTMIDDLAIWRQIHLARGNFDI